MAAFESVAAAFATLILFALFEDEMTRRQADFVSTQMAGVGQLLVVLDSEERRRATRENRRKDRQTRGFEVAIGATEK